MEHFDPHALHYFPLPTTSLHSLTPLNIFTHSLHSLTHSLTHSRTHPLTSTSTRVSCAAAAASGASGGWCPSWWWWLRRSPRRRALAPHISQLSENVHELHNNPLHLPPPSEAPASGASEVRGRSRRCR